MPLWSVWNDADIEKMVKDAEANAEADKSRRELVETKNQAESLLHSTRKSLDEHGDKVDSSTVEAIELAVGALEDALKSEDAGKIKGGIQNLMDASMKLGEAIYKAGQSSDEAQGRDADAPRDIDDDVGGTGRGTIVVPHVIARLERVADIQDRVNRRIAATMRDAARGSGGERRGGDQPGEQDGADHARRSRERRARSSGAFATSRCGTLRARVHERGFGAAFHRLVTPDSIRRPAAFRDGGQEAGSRDQVRDHGSA